MNINNIKLRNQRHEVKKLFLLNFIYVVQVNLGLWDLLSKITINVDNICIKYFSIKVYRRIQYIN
ncbi:hypothetical protein C3B55_00677 [Candidatus Pseudomonas adelgestsugas]|uniref:Transmembrane protein n=1 Tax=Candidatus Pseudomonas adelgestsugas TaxID=1302376 RepID=A0ABX5R8M2_9PSED|nr:hypothetical protein C3B55_00677 [Candidatus Pseudomonas adelgestsugas]